MSLHDPSAPRPARVVFAVTIGVAALAAAAVAGWGWGGADPGQDGADVGPHVVALFVGQLLSILLLIATGFALPYRWRTAKGAGSAIAGLAGLELVVGAAGFVVAGGSPAGAIGLAVVGALVLLITAVALVRSRRRDRTHDEVVAQGVTTTGVVTEASTSEMVNNVPRWRVVVKFVDSAGADRWFTDHRTTYRPPAQGHPVVVHFDPSRPGDRHRIFVDY